MSSTAGTDSTPVTTDNAATVARLYEAFGRGDVPTILAALADDVRWEDWADNHAQRAGVAHLAPRRGPEDVAGFFELLRGWTVERFEVLDLIGTGRQVVAEVSASFRTPGGGRLEDEELHLWTFDDAGRVTRLRHYADTAKHIAATGGAAAPGE
ncbi:nuclear transport factor 2 family protein [Geodermatophilus sp. CPCC 206100]|uniref:nuclear transport factor 2 family protein n=1 Tax=Geodermatophilus sp. CPCC 206100 TaxID=3020054 RepID=UPI003AFF8993